MNMIRMMTIALPMTLLLACGGGGGGTAAVTPSAETSETRYPNIPEPVFLPSYPVRGFIEAQNVAVNARPASMTETQIISILRTRAAVADTFEFSGFSETPNSDIACANTSRSCSSYVSGTDYLTFSLADIDDLSLVDDTLLTGFNSESRAVIVTNGERITMVQSRSAGRHRNGAGLSFQTYGGWLDNSVFGVELLDVTEGATTTNRFASFSFGTASNSNPGHGSWNGVMVGADTGTDDIVQGNATVTVSLGAANSGDIRFSNIRNLDTGASVGDVAAGFRWTNGTFSGFTNTPGTPGLTMLEGSFYGDNNEEVGGIFRTENNILGAFGASNR